MNGAAPVLGGAGAAVTLALGLLLCATAVTALRMVMRAWNGRLAFAAEHPMVHVTWRRFDTMAVTLWSTVYTLGVAAVAAGLWFLLP